MTTITENIPKAKPAFYIFAQDAEGHSFRVGAVFKHKKGNGVNIVIGNGRYAAFPPKAITEEESA